MDGSESADTRSSSPLSLAMIGLLFVVVGAGALVAVRLFGIPAIGFPITRFITAFLFFFVVVGGFLGVLFIGIGLRIIWSTWRMSASPADDDDDEGDESEFPYGDEYVNEADDVPRGVPIDILMHPLVDELLKDEDEQDGDGDGDGDDGQEEIGAEENSGQGESRTTVIVISGQTPIEQSRWEEHRFWLWVWGFFLGAVVLALVVCVGAARTTKNSSARESYSRTAVFLTKAALMLGAGFLWSYQRWRRLYPVTAEEMARILEIAPEDVSRLRDYAKPRESTTVAAAPYGADEETATHPAHGIPHHLLADPINDDEDDEAR